MPRARARSRQPAELRAANSPGEWRLRVQGSRRVFVLSSRSRTQVSGACWVLPAAVLPSISRSVNFGLREVQFAPRAYRSKCPYPYVVIQTKPVCTLVAEANMSRCNSDPYTMKCMKGRFIGLCLIRDKRKKQVASLQEILGILGYPEAGNRDLCNYYRKYLL